MKVLIVGGGIAGLTLAAFLKDSNVSYDIVEKSADWTNRGFLISLWDSARDILKKLGLSDKLDQSGVPAHTYSVRHGDGSVIRNIDLSTFCAQYGGSITILPRADLHGWLLEKVGADNIRMGISVAKCARDGEQIEVSFTNGHQGRYDVIVGADGVHSKIRQLFFDHCYEKYENWRVWYAWISHEFATKATIVEIVAPREFTIVCTTGMLTNAWFFAPVDHAERDSEKGRVERLKQLLKDERFLLPAIEKLHDSDLVPSDLITLSLKHWYRDNVVLLGDAAHSMGPHAGIGSTMAMEDAYVLAAQLLKATPEYPLQNALRRYESLRKPRMRHAEYLSQIIKFGTLAKSHPMRVLIDTFLPFVPRWFLLFHLQILLKNEI
ncbi:MAG TPA: NAD(P)/FAD-dependent oxidoreductase [Candidatus Paceibacterota bacterium]